MTNDAAQAYVDGWGAGYYRRIDEVEESVNTHYANGVRDGIRDRKAAVFTPKPEAKCECGIPRVEHLMPTLCVMDWHLSNGGVVVY